MFIFGDLNYRIDLPNASVRHDVEKKDYSKLKEYDELITSFKTFKDSPDPSHILKIINTSSTETMKKEK